MRTTIRLEAALLEQARCEAERRGMTLTAHFKQGLRLAIWRPRPVDSSALVKLPVSRSRGGVIAGDVSSGAAVIRRW